MRKAGRSWRRWLRPSSISAVALLAAGNAQAELSEFDAAKVNSAAMFFAMGSIAFGECQKVGFRVNPNGWHALLESAAPAGVTGKDFITGGRFSEAGRNALSYVGSIQMEAGAPAWCSYMAAWAKVAHPTIWQSLISK